MKESNARLKADLDATLKRNADTKLQLAAIANQKAELAAITKDVKQIQKRQSVYKRRDIKPTDLPELKDQEKQISQLNTRLDKLKESAQ
jgi:predicted  nucleic acid-binding Zn-ribbon protein